MKIEGIQSKITWFKPEDKLPEIALHSLRDGFNGVVTVKVLATDGDDIGIVDFHIEQRTKLYDWKLTVWDGSEVKLWAYIDIPNV